MCIKTFWLLYKNQLQTSHFFQNITCSALSLYCDLGHISRILVSMFCNIYKYKYPDVFHVPVYSVFKINDFIFEHPHILTKYWATFDGVCGCFSSKSKSKNNQIPSIILHCIISVLRFLQRVIFSQDSLLKSKKNKILLIYLKTKVILV